MLQAKSILLNYDNLRYRLLPYIYSLAWKVTNEGYTIMRSLAFDFRDDAGIKSIPDQYMFGPAFLVNPVTKRMYSLPGNKKFQKDPKVYLPASADWYDFWTGKLIKGGQTIDAVAPIETIPLYTKRVRLLLWDHIFSMLLKKLLTRLKSEFTQEPMPNSFFTRMKTIPIITNQARMRYYT